MLPRVVIRKLDEQYPGKKTLSGVIFKTSHDAHKYHTQGCGERGCLAAEHLTRVEHLVFSPELGAKL